jgi:hypothetical protein
MPRSSPPCVIRGLWRTDGTFSNFTAGALPEEYDQGNYWRLERVGESCGGSVEQLVGLFLEQQVSKLEGGFEHGPAQQTQSLGCIE